MNDFLKMDIFFVVATIGVAALTCLACYVLWRIARILKHVEHISEQISTESDNIRQDLAEMRGEIRAGKSRIKAFFTFLSGITKKTKRAPKEAKAATH